MSGALAFSILVPLWGIVILLSMLLSARRDPAADLYRAMHPPSPLGTWRSTVGSILAVAGFVLLFIHQLLGWILLAVAVVFFLCEEEPHT